MSPERGAEHSAGGSWLQRLSQLRSFLYELIAREGKFATLYVDLESLYSPGSGLGPDTRSQLQHQVHAEIRRFVVDHTGYLMTPAVLDSKEDIVIVTVAQGRPITVEDAQRLSTQLALRLNSRCGPGDNSAALAVGPFCVGHALGYLNGVHDADRALNRVLKEARRLSKTLVDPTDREMFQKVRELIELNQIRVVYQPIVSLADGSVLGYECFCRGPGGTPLERPEVLFQTATFCDLVYALEQQVQQRILEQMSTLEQGLFFVNLEPHLLDGNRYARLPLFQEGAPQRLVFDVHERLVMHDYKRIRFVFDDLRERGLRVALDHVGSEGIRLEEMDLLQPDFIKITPGTFVRSGRSQAQASWWEELRARQAQGRMVLIAERVERKEELKRAYHVGVRYALGNVLAGPADTPRSPRAPAPWAKIVGELAR